MTRRLLGKMKKVGDIHWTHVKEEGNGVTATEKIDGKKGRDRPRQMNLHSVAEDLGILYSIQS